MSWNAQKNSMQHTYQGQIPFGNSQLAGLGAATIGNGTRLRVENKQPFDHEQLRKHDANCCRTQ